MHAWLVAVLASILPATGATTAAEEAVFRLCASRVADAAVVERPRGAVVRVLLTEAAAVEFARLTRAGQGEMLVVLAGEEVLSRAVVRAPVESGRLVSRVLSESAVARLRRALLTPCSPGNGTGESAGR